MKKLLYIFILLTTYISATTPTYENVTKLYVATFNRAPDSAGLEYWVSKSNLSLEGIAKSFFDQPETKALYPDNYKNRKFIEAIYQNVLGRKPDIAGERYWLNELNSNNIQRPLFILAIVNGALGNDSTLLEKKTEVGLKFAKSGMDDIEAAKQVMKFVTADSSIDEIFNRAGFIKSSSGYCYDEQECDDIIDNSNENYSPPSEDNSPKKAGWYMRTIVEADLENDKKYIQSKAGVFGEYSDSIDGRDRHDIPSMGTSILRVVFIHQEWEKQKSFFSDYRAYRSVDREVWTFQVKNDRDVNLANAILKISLQGPYDIYLYKKGNFEERLSNDNSLKRAIKLIDIDNHKVYSYGDSKYITLSMDGKHTRTFRWVIGDVRDEDYEPINSIESRSLLFRRRVGYKFGLPPN